MGPLCADASRPLGEPAQKALEAIGRGEGWLALRLTLAGAGIDEGVLPHVLDEALGIGRRWARELWEPADDVHTNLRRLGVCGVRDMSPMEERAWRVRALFDPMSSEVLVSEGRLLEMADVQRELGLTLFSPEGLRAVLLAHECFHCLEESRGERLSELLAQGDPLPAAVRDVGANAFSHAALGGPPCQAVDVLWLAARAPRRLDALLAARL